MADALAADGPDPDHADKLALFGRLVGSWDCAGRFFEPDGAVRSTHVAEWHFAWVLDGRAVQDVLVSPPRRDRRAGQPFFEYGTTLRVYDPRIEAWRITFASAVNGTVVNLLARQRGDEIWLEGRAPDNRLFRWTFSEITDTSVRWQGFVSTDEALTWVRDEEILLSRRRSPSGD